MILRNARCNDEDPEPLLLSVINLISNHPFLWIRVRIHVVYSVATIPSFTACSEWKFLWSYKIRGFDYTTYNMPHSLRLLTALFCTWFWSICHV